MDVSTAGLINAAVEMKQTQAAEAVQLSVLKKTMDVQANAAMVLLQAVPAPLPLATSGALGTQLNQLV